MKKILLVFKHINILVYQENAYYYHQRYHLIPAVVQHWRTYKARIAQSLEGKQLLLAGDGRHDSMGHSAKYGTYSIFCCNAGRIIHIDLVQVSLQIISDVTCDRY